MTFENWFDAFVAIYALIGLITACVFVRKVSAEGQSVWSGGWFIAIVGLFSIGMMWPCYVISVRRWPK